MDKYEYSLKMEQLRELCAEGKYEEAADLADSIGWSKIRNVNTLVKIGEVYEHVGRYEDSKEVLLNAYDRSPIGRTIIYRLAEVALKMGDFESAIEYYREFVDIAPNDNQRYVLRYNIRKAQSAPLAELIQILEELKDQEYTEEWAYELALLYHKSGSVEKCVDACDELILWFGDGPYVENALELKMMYQPLTKVQEEKYRRFRHEREGKTLIGAEEMERAGEFTHDPVVIPQVTLNPSRFNTTNLQEEIAKGMQQIMEATEKSTVVGTMDNIKKIVEDIPYLHITKDQIVIKEPQAQHIETDEEIDGSLKINFQELLGEDSDGQISLVTDEKARLQQQITGQMTIADVLEEWERTKRAAEAALKDAEQRKLESAKARALQEAEDLMERLNDVLPKIEAGVTPKEFLEEEYLQAVNATMDREIARLHTENERLAAEIAAEVQFGRTMRFQEDDLSAIKAAVADFGSEEEVQEAETAVPIAEETEVTEENISESVDLTTEEEEVLPEETVGAGDELPEESVKMEEEFTEEAEIPEENIVTEEPVAEEKTEKTYENNGGKLTAPQREIFSYMCHVYGMEEQLSKAVGAIVKNLKENGSSVRGNLIIQGNRRSGKTVLATNFVRVLQKECGYPNGKVGKISAEALNNKDMQQLLKKIAGGCLIIERAGELSRPTAVTLSLLLEQDSSGILVILEDTETGITRALRQDDGFAKKFTEKIIIPEFSNDDLVNFANVYANEQGYVIDEMAVLAIHNRISEIERLDEMTSLDEMKDIIDDAIECEAHSGLRKFIGIFTAARYTDDEKIVLREKDFE